MSSKEQNAFVFTALVAFLLHFIVAHVSPTLVWPDEVFQTLEQGHRWMWGYGVIPWEFRDGVRSWVLPGLLGLVMRATSGLGPGSYGYLLGVRLFLSLCSIVPVVIAMLWARRAKLKAFWVAGLATAVWFELVFFSSKALTEVMAAYTLAPALYFSVAAREDPPPSRAAIWAGLFWGLTVSFRMHLAPAAAVAIAFICEKELRLWKQLLPTAAAVVLAYGLVDWFTWSYPFQSFIENFRVNIFQGKAATYGVEPPWEYLRCFAIVWSWGGIVLLGLAAFSFKRWPVLGVTALFILVVHSAIAHKEYRFMAPLFVVVVIAASLELARLVEARRELGLVACLLFVLASADGARRYELKDLTPRFKSTNLPPYPMWTIRNREIRLIATLSTNDTICGLGAVAVGWGWTGGYTYLHKDVPIYDVRTLEELAKYRNHFNYAISDEDNAAKLAPMVIEQCWDSTCLYRRDGPCEPPGDYSFNEYLKNTGM